MVSRYTIPEYLGEDIDSILDYGQYGKYLYRTKLVWKTDSNREDIILYSKFINSKELESDLSFDLTIYKESKDITTSIIKEYCDCFVKDGAKRTILGYDFGINTGGAKPACCKNPLYDPYKSKIIMTQFNQILGMD